MGMSRTVKDGRVTAFEFVRIARIDGVLTYLAQPGGGDATAFVERGRRRLDPLRKPKPRLPATHRLSA